MTSLPLHPLTSESFAPYGTIISHQGQERRYFLPLDLGCAEDATLTVMSWVTRIDAPLAGGPVLTEMERHPHSDQAFVPLSGQRYLVIVCDSDATGAPDAATLKGFVAAPGQGVIYRRMSWHGGMQVLDAPAEFFVQMKRRAAGDDDVFVALPDPVLIELEGIWA